MAGLRERFWKDLRRPSSIQNTGKLTDFVFFLRVAEKNRHGEEISPLGVPEIDDSFVLDDKQKGQSSAVETDIIVKEVEKLKAEDEPKRARIDTRYGLECMCYKTNNQFGGKIKPVGDYCMQVLRWVEDNPEARTEELSAKMTEFQSINFVPLFSIISFRTFFEGKFENSFHVTSPYL